MSAKHPAYTEKPNRLATWGSLVLTVSVLLLLLMLSSKASAEEFNCYFGNTHSHTTYSDGAGTPAEHYQLAKSKGFDFYAITNHALAKYPNFTPQTYEDTKREANNFNSSTFVAICGFEFSENDGPAGTGHLNALNTASYLDATGKTVNLPVFYDWLVNNQSTTVAASFNHPGTGSYNSFDYLTNARRDMVTMLEVINSGNLHYDAYIAALNKGWRVAPIAGLDNHGTGRITSHFYRTGVLATSLTRESIMQAMKARRVYATWDQNLKLIVRANGQIMGSVMGIPSSLGFSVSVSDPDTGNANDKITKMELVGNNGAVLASQSFSAHNVTWNPNTAPKAGYYFFNIYAADKTDGPTAYSAPVWLDASVAPAPAVPAAPSGLNATATSTSQINLSWNDNSGNESGFKIERKTGAGGAWGQVATVGANVKAYSNTGLSASTTYYYRVRAYNGTGDSGYSNEANATTQSNTPAPTGGIRVSGNKLLRNGQPFIALGFTMVGLLSPNQTGMAGTAGQHYNQNELNVAKSWGANTLRFQVSQRGFDPQDSLYSAAYIQRVRDGVALARQNGFAVILSMQDQSLSGGDATPMPEPQTLRSWGEVTKYFNNDLEIMYELWNEPMVKDTAAEWVLWQTGGTLNGQTVIGHQQLLDKVRSSGAQNVCIAEGTRVGKSFVGCPDLSDPLHQLAYGIHPYMNWPLTDEASYDAHFGNWAQKYPIVATEWCAHSFSNFSQDDWPAKTPILLAYLKAHGIGLTAWALDIPDTLIKDWNYTPTTLVGFKAGVRGNGPGEDVKAYFLNYYGGVPTVPTNLNAQAVSSSQINLTWKDNASNETGYKIERKTGAGGSWAQITTTGANATGYSNTGLTSNTTFYYRVRASGGSGDSGYSNEANATTYAPANQAPLVKTAAKATPNPVTGKTTVLSVLGDDDAGEAKLTYTWNTTSAPAAVTFSANGNNAAKQSTATFSKAGSYSFKVTLKDELGLTASSSVNVTVTASVDQVSVTPATASVQINQMQQFAASAKDQFGADMNPTFSWSVNGSGTINTTGLFTASGTAGGPHTITATSDGKSGTATVSVYAPAPTGNGNGLLGEYFDTQFFATPKVNRVDPKVDFDWGTGSPATGVAPDTFSARWSGEIQAQYTETYTFSTVSDDGVRLWVNGQLLVDNWTDHAPVEDSGSLKLTAGQKYSIRMDYYENGGGAVARLLWSSASTSKQVVPQSQLYAASLRDPDITGPIVNGLEYWYYQGNWIVMPDFSKETVLKKGTVSNFDLGQRTQNDFFGFRFQGYVDVPSDGVYTFYTTSDDGSQFSVGDQLVVNNDGLHGVQEASGTIGLKAGTHAIKLKYFEGTGSETLTVSWEGPGIAKQAMPVGRLYRRNFAQGDGLLATYFDNEDLSGQTISRVDKTIDFDWGTSAPVAGIDADTFSARWTGYIVPPASGTYTFIGRTDDGVRLWINGQLILDNWTRHAVADTSGAIALTGGQRYSIRMEYYEGPVNAVAQLYWSGPGIARQIVPQSALYSK